MNMIYYKGIKNLFNDFIWFFFPLMVFKILFFNNVNFTNIKHFFKTIFINNYYF